MSLQDSEVRKFLSRKLFAKLGTISKDGYPHVTPVWYIVDGQSLVVNTTKDRVKMKNIKRNNKVSLLIDDKYRYVLIFGRAETADERDPKEDIKKLAIRYHGRKEGEKLGAEYSKQERVSLRIIPEKVVVHL